MNTNNIEVDFKAKAGRLEQYALHEFPRMAVRKTLRFIDGNFRAQGWQGSSFKYWKANTSKTTILIKSGRLRRSFHDETGPGMIRIWSDSPYARAHNRGFNGTVKVKAFTRSKYTPEKVGTGRFTKSGNERMKTVHRLTSSVQVQAHERHMNIPQRKFMPESPGDSPVLMAAIRRDVIREIKSIFGNT